MVLHAEFSAKPIRFIILLLCRLMDFMDIIIFFQSSLSEKTIHITAYWIYYLFNKSAKTGGLFKRTLRYAILTCYEKYANAIRPVFSCFFVRHFIYTQIHYTFHRLTYISNNNSKYFFVVVYNIW